MYLLTIGAVKYASNDIDKLKKIAQDYLDESARQYPNEKVSTIDWWYEKDGLIIGRYIIAKQLGKTIIESVKVV